MELTFTRPNQKTTVHFLRTHGDLSRQLKEDCAAHGASVFFDGGLGKVWRQRIIGFGVSEKRIFEMLPGESSKQWDEIGRGIAFLQSHAHERTAPLFVIGGGACLDAGALIASIYRRGVPLVLMPTTLLSMVDATIGGKTAVNQKVGETVYKNVAGTFYPAERVLYWPGWLESLTRRDRLSGVGELLKTLWLSNQEVDSHVLRGWIDGEVSESEIWPYLRAAVAYKISVVESDPLDALGKREILNFGHTLGHALESLSKGKVSHGEAIAWGMWAESRYVGAADTRFSDEIRSRIQAVGFDTPDIANMIEPGAIAACLFSDKKMKGGRVPVSALVDFGRVESVNAQPHELAKFAAKAFQEL